MQQTTETVVSAAPLEEKSTATTIPFFKNNELDYAELLAWTGEGYQNWAWIVFIPIVIFIITAVYTFLPTAKVEFFMLIRGIFFI